MGSDEAAIRAPILLERGTDDTTAKSSPRPGSVLQTRIAPPCMLASLFTGATGFDVGCEP
jgi:hypothetical protein